MHADAARAFDDRFGPLGGLRLPGGLGTVERGRHTLHFFLHGHTSTKGALTYDAVSYGTGGSGGWGEPELTPVPGSGYPARGCQTHPPRGRHPIVAILTRIDPP
ncbi:hypothetical protein GCM10017567_13130 [Amycolatopsis bullii]|uniref:Uncharacterized protein n=1 Tax=Amycolatopsis bullii TaxID=941987 RepID=A0ABQ3K2V1_9PSEU|nr:hypothetical protein GCM10017567_13130 [Amycolatopsis bullii]